MVVMADIPRIYRTEQIPPANVCIYCRNTENLTDEHVVPFGLGGNLQLRSASCPACNKITNRFETAVLRGFILEARIAARFPTRNPKRRTKTPPSSGILLLPVFERPTFLTGQHSMQPGGLLKGVETFRFGNPPEDAPPGGLAPSEMKPHRIDPTSFVRMLAKIGYGFAVSLWGPYPLNEVPVLPLILGSADDQSVWVGSSDGRPLIIRDELRARPEPIKIGVEIFTYDDGLVNELPERVSTARIVLLADTDAKGYEVVVRRKRLLLYPANARPAENRSFFLWTNP